MNQNEEHRRQIAYNRLLQGLDGIPLSADIAKAIHLDWADNVSYNEVLDTPTENIKELVRESFGGLGMNNNVGRIDDNQYSTIKEEFGKYLKTKEGLNAQGGKRKTRKTKKSKRSKKTRKH